VRELENLVKRIVVLESEEFVTQELSAKEAGLSAAATSTGLRSHGSNAPAAPAHPAATPADESPSRRAPAWSPGVGLKEVARQAIREAEQRVIKQVLDEVRWNRVEASRRLKISYKALLYKIQMYGLGNARSTGKTLP